MLQGIFRTKATARRYGPAAAWVFLMLLLPAVASSSNIKVNGIDAGTNDLQAVINSASLGDVIELTAGASFTDIDLPNKTTGNGYITIRSSQLSQLPQHKRVSPADVVHMATILATPDGGGNEPAVRALPGSHHYRFEGIEFTSNVTTYLHTILRLGGTTSEQATLADVPHHIDVDRCYIHSAEGQNVAKGIQLHTSNSAITNCYFYIVHTDNGDNNTIWSINGPGPYFIVNNYLAANGENILTGGAFKRISGMFPSDFNIRRNHFHKPIAWRTQSPDPDVKNLFETKIGKRFGIYENLFDTSWHDAQSIAISFKSATQGYTPASEYDTTDIDFHNNWVRHAPKGLGIFEESAGTTMARVAVRNNLWTDLNEEYWGLGQSMDGSFLYIGKSASDILIDHNTIFHNHFLIFFGDGSTYTVDNFYFTNNLSHNATIDGGATFNSLEGVFQGGQGWDGGDDVLNARAPSSVSPPDNFTNNVIQNTDSAWANRYALHSQSPYANWLPSGFGTTNSDDIRMENFVNGRGPDINSGEDFRLRSDSMYKAGGSRDGTDGKDLGADIDLINAGLGGEIDNPGNSSIISGDWEANDVILYAAEAPTKAGSWTVTTDATAAEGESLRDPNSGTPRIDTALASPTHYFEMTFQAEAGVGYRMWTRGKAESDSTSNDSVHVQFDKSLDGPGGSAVNRIGTTDSMMVAVENFSGDGVQSWGWTDADGANGSGQLVYFSTSGTQTIRVQRREDGIAIDQIVLSPSTYRGIDPLNPPPSFITPANAAPGTTKNDTTILPKTASAPVTITLKNGVNGYTGGDSFSVSGGSPTTHLSDARYYHSINLHAGTSGSVNRAFYKFDLSQGSNAIPANSNIISATLRMKLEMNTSATTISAYRMAPSTGFTVSYSAATRNTYDGTNSWTGGTNAGDQDHLTPADSALTPPAVGQWLEFDVTSSVQAFVNGTANNGWVIKVNSGTIRTSTTLDSAGSSEYAELVVEYQ